ELARKADELRRRARFHKDYPPDVAGSDLRKRGAVLKKFLDDFRQPPTAAETVKHDRVVQEYKQVQSRLEIEDFLRNAPPDRGECLRRACQLLDEHPTPETKELLQRATQKWLADWGLKLLGKKSTEAFSRLREGVRNDDTRMRGVFERFATDPG